MNIGKLIKKNGEFFIKDLATEDRHYVPNGESLELFSYYSFETNEDDDAVDLTPAVAALIEYGIRPDTGSFYTSEDADEAESYFGTCELTGMRGDIVPCRYLSTSGEVISLEVGTWLVHSVLGKLAGAF